MSQWRPESVLTEWRALGLPFASAPRLLRALPGGLTNTSWLIEADETRWVLRRDDRDAAALGVDRAREWRLHALAANAGLAPPIAHVDAARGLMLTAFVAGEHADPSRLDARQRAQLFDLLRGVHALVVDEPSRDYRAYCRAYRPGVPLSPTLDALIGRLEQHAAIGLGHHDAVPANVLFTPTGALLIDWEYAARGWTVLDWATLAVDWGLPREDIVRQAGVPAAVIDDACALYTTICALWHAVAARR